MILNYLRIAMIVFSCHFRGRYYVSALIRPFRRNLSVTQTKLFMGSNNISPLPALVTKVSSTNGHDRMDALETLRSIIDDFDDDGDLSEAMGAWSSSYSRFYNIN